jgi:hypothetical protein
VLATLMLTRLRKLGTDDSRVTRVMRYVGNPYAHLAPYLFAPESDVRATL